MTNLPALDRSRAVPRSLALVAINHLGFLASGYVIQLGMARLLLPTEYGDFSVVLGVITASSLFVTNGAPQTAARLLADSKWRASWVEHRAHLSLWSTIAAVGVFHVIVVLAWTQAIHDSSLRRLLLLSVLVLPAYGLSSLYLGFLTGHGHFRGYGLAGLFTSILKPVLVFAFVMMGFGIGGAVVGYAFAGVFQAGIARTFHRRILHDELGITNPTENTHWMAAQYTIISVLVLLLSTVDLFLVRSLPGTELSTGSYGAAQTISRLLFFGFSALSVYLLPQAADPRSRRIGEVVGRNLRDLLRLLPSALVACALVVYLLSEVLISFAFPQAYLPASDFLKIVIWSSAGTVIASLYANLFFSRGYGTAAIGILAVGLVVEIGLVLLLEPRFGATGVAMGSAGGALLCSLGFLLFAKRAELEAPLSRWTMGAAGALTSILLATTLSIEWNGIGIPIAGLMFVVVFYALALIGGDATRIRALIQ